MSSPTPMTSAGPVAYASSPLVSPAKAKNNTDTRPRKCCRCSRFTLRNTHRQWTSKLSVPLSDANEYELWSCSVCGNTVGRKLSGGPSTDIRYTQDSIGYGTTGGD